MFGEEEEERVKIVEQEEEPKTAMNKKKKNQKNQSSKQKNKKPRDKEETEEEEDNDKEEPEPVMKRKKTQLNKKKNDKKNKKDEPEEENNDDDKPISIKNKPVKKDQIDDDQSNDEEEQKPSIGKKKKKLPKKKNDKQINKDEQEENEEDKNDEQINKDNNEEEENDEDVYDKNRICPKSIYDTLSNNSKKLIVRADTDSNAQLSVARDFFDGVGKFPKNHKIAIRYLFESIENGNEDAALYYNDKVISSQKSINQANNFVQSHLKDNNPVIFLLNGLLYMRYNDYDNAIKFFHQSAMNWISRAHHELGRIYQKGLGVKVNSKISIEYFTLSKKIKRNEIPENIKKKPCKLPDMPEQVQNKQADKDESPKVLYDKGMKSINNGSIDDAIHYFNLAAKKDDIKSIKEMINIYMNGTTKTEIDYKKALKYLKMAVKLGDVDSMREAAEMYQEGKGVQQTLAEAVRLYKLASENGDSESMYRYGLMLEKGEGTKQNLQLAFKQLKLAAKENRKAMYHCGKMLMNGTGTPVDMSRAIEYFQKAADQGNKKAQRELEKMKHIKVQIDADDGNVDAMFTYGMMLLEGNDVQQDEKQAIKYLKKASNNGHKEASIVLKKHEVEKVKEKIARGDTKAMIKLAKMLVEGKVLKKNYKHAIKYLNQAIDAGDREAKGELKKVKELQLLESNDPKELFFYGKDVEFKLKKPNEALKWYKKAADLDFVPAMVSYAKILDSSIKDFRNSIRLHKTPKISKEDYENLQVEALRYYKIAAEKGNKIALHFYGLYLEHGNGTKVNKKKAVECYIAASQKGNLEALSNYARCLEHGIGIKQDEYKALELYKKAMKKGSKRAIGEYQYLYDKLKQNEKENSDDDDIQEEEEEEEEERNDSDDEDDEDDEINVDNDEVDNDDDFDDNDDDDDDDDYED